jgi:hypothetical protein
MAEGWKENLFLKIDYYCVKYGQKCWKNMQKWWKKVEKV